MTSTKSSRKVYELEQTYRWALHQVKGVAGLYTLLCLLAFPLLTYFSLRIDRGGLIDAQQYAAVLNDSFKSLAMVQFSVLIPLLSALTALVLLALLFGYMQQKRSVDMMHALPVGRTPLLMGKFLAGLTVLIVPVVLGFLCSVAVGGLCGASAAGLWHLLWQFCIVITACFSFALFLCVCCGRMFDTIVTIVAICVAWPVVLALGAIVTEMLLPGYTASSFSLFNPIITALSPFLALPLVQARQAAGWGVWVWWAAFAAVCIVGTVLLYRRRKSEKAESGFAFAIPQIVVRFLLTAAAGLGFAFLMFSAFNQAGYLLIGLLIGSAMAHLVIEGVYHRGFSHLKKSLPWYGAFLAVCAVFVAMLGTGFFGYTARVPAAEDVESIVYDDRSIQQTSFHRWEGDGYSFGELNPQFTDEAEIAEAIGLHKEFAAGLKGFLTNLSDLSQGGGHDFTVTFCLKNGQKIIRAYDTNRLRQAEVLRGHLQEMSGYLESASVIPYLQPGDLSGTKFVAENRDDNGNYATKQAEIPAQARQALLDAMKKDLPGLLTNRGWYVEESAVPKAETLTYSLQLAGSQFSKEGPLKAFIGLKAGEEISFDNLTYYLDQQATPAIWGVVQDYHLIDLLKDTGNNG